MTARPRQAPEYAEALLSATEREALVRAGPFRFPVKGEWSTQKAAAFSAQVASLVHGERSHAIASFVLLVRSIGQLPREGAFADPALVRWGAGLVQALHDVDPTLLARRTMWTFVSTLNGNALVTLQATRMYFPGDAVTPAVASLLLESLDDHILGVAHTELRQDGQANALLWLDDLSLQAAKLGRKKAPPRPVDTLLQQPMGLERLMEKMSADGPRGEAGRRLMNRLAVRMAEHGGLDFMTAKSGRIGDDAWRERPLKLLASELVERARSRSWSTASVDQSLRDLSAITGIPLADAARRFGTHFCSAIAAEAHGSGWTSLTSALVPPAGRPSPADEVVACLERHQVLDLEFMRQLRSAFFDHSRPDYRAGNDFEARFAPMQTAMETALALRTHIAAGAPAIAPPSSSPRSRRMGL